MGSPNEFSLRWIQKEKFSQLIKVADFIEKSGSRYIYRINNEKCKGLSKKEFKAVLESLKGIIPEEIIKKILDIREGIIEIKLDGSDLIIKNLGYFQSIERYANFDSKNNVYRAQPYFFKNIIDFLKNEGFKVKYDLPNWKLDTPVQPKFRLKSYQREAYKKWKENNMRGIVVLPTGAGKTYVALWAISKIKERTLIILPTIDLLNQWKDKIMIELGINDVGLFGGGDKDIRQITIATYSSAYLNAELLADKFGFVVFDEVHHLPSPKYRIIAETLIAWKRMGLSATPEREDELHVELSQLVGPVVYRKSPTELQKQKHIARFEIKRIEVPLDPKYEQEYREFMYKYKEALHKLNLTMRSKADFERLILLSGRSKIAHDALVWREKAKKIALNAEPKLKILESILLGNKDKKILIFTKYTSIVNRISRMFGIPKITHKTKKDERREILSSFRQGKLSKIVTSEVLDEGTDVPDANMGIIVSGTGSKRQFIQRLGRLLRPKEESAILIELVTKGTMETHISSKRKKSII